MFQTRQATDFEEYRLIKGVGVGDGQEQARNEEVAQEYVQFMY
jgi:hypothetical protein